jgi:ABC-type lipoprotein export system ATPase subunit
MRGSLSPLEFDEMAVTMNEDQRAPGSVVIEAHDVVKTYDTGTVEVRALKGVSLAVNKGGMVAIMGPSGCGKTTLLNSLSGLDDIDSGLILIEGVDITTMADDRKTEFRARDMGFVFQTYNLLPVLTAAENVELPLIVSGTKPKVAREKALASLERVNLRDRWNARPAALSGGQRQRVTIARALVNRPAIIWADEPTGALDSRTATEIMDLIVELNQEEHQTCVIVTHDPKVAARCDRTIHMADGEIVREASREQMQAVAAGAVAAI